jgi:hypothetical protein
MITKKTFLFLPLFIWATVQISGQVTVLHSYKPSGTDTKPQTYNTNTNPVETESVNDRRNAALSKVQAKAPKSAVSAKGVAPAQYSTDGPAPVQYSESPHPSTTMTVNGQNVQRNVRKGKGQVGDELFTPVSELFYVQFAVYCKNTPVDKAPPIEGLFLLWHPDSQCPGGEPGASYIVKGYGTADEAKAAVFEYKAQKIDCWYNPALTGAEVEVIGVR